jgi:hypothetical protein
MDKYSSIEVTAKNLSRKKANLIQTILRLILLLIGVKDFGLSTTEKSEQDLVDEVENE